MNSDKLAKALGRQPFQNWPLDPKHIPDSPNWHFDRSIDRNNSLKNIENELYKRPQL